MEVDSFRYVSRLIGRYYKLSRIDRELPISLGKHIGSFLRGIRRGIRS